MTLRRIIKLFRFDEENRSRITLDDGTRLDPDLSTPGIKLAIDPATGAFPTGPNLSVRTWLTEPTSVTQWVGFQAVDILPRDPCEPTSPTKLQFRLSDGTADYFWDGTTWTTPVPVDTWNVESEIADNIDSFLTTVQSRKLQVVINLATDDNEQTPTLIELKVLYFSNVEFQEDLVLRSLIPELKAKMRPVTDYVVGVTDTQTRIGIGPDGDDSLDVAYQIVGVQAAFDETADPLKINDLGATFDLSTKEVVLPATLPAAGDVFLKLIYEPIVAIRTSQDFTEVEDVPLLVLDSISLEEASELPGGTDSVVNRLTGASVVVPSPIQGDLVITMSFYTDKHVDHQRIADELKRFFGNTPLLRSRGLDEVFRLWLTDEYGMSDSPDESDINRGELTFRIVGGLFFYRDAFDATAVTAFTMRFGEGEEFGVALNTVFFGKGPDGIASEAAILALGNSLVAPSRAWEFTLATDVDEFGYMAYPAALGDAQVFLGGSALPGGMAQVGGAGNTIDVNGVPHILLQTDDDELGVIEYKAR